MRYRAQSKKMYQSSASGHTCPQYVGSYGMPSLYPQAQNFGYNRFCYGQTSRSDGIEGSRLPIPLPSLFGGMRPHSCLPRGYGKEVTQGTKAGSSSASSSSAPPRSASVQVTLNDYPTWKAFDVIGNEMIVTKPGR